MSGKRKKRCDKKVERILRTKGLREAEVFYGPQRIWWWTVISMLLLAGAYLFPAFRWIGWWGIPFLFLYLIIGYLVSGRYYNSIAVTDKELIVVNSNALFNRYTAFPLDQVRLVTMGAESSVLAQFFCLFGNNYIEIGTNTDLQLFYCSGIEEHDGYGNEGQVDKTLEDLSLLLKKKGIAVQFDF